MTIKEYLSRNRLLTDGAMGTYYSDLENNRELISEFANLTAPDKIKKIHKDYLAAGAMLLRTNTFAANTKVLSLQRDELKKMLHSAVQIAKEAVAEHLKGLNSTAQTTNCCTPFIAGDIGPIPAGSDIEEEEAFTEYCFIADELICAGVDAILFETFPEETTILRVAEYIKEKHPDLFIMAEITVGMSGYGKSGMSASRLLESLARNAAVDACGFNCGIGSGHMIQLLKSLRLPKDKYLMVSPNAGYPEILQSRMVFMNNAEYFAKNMREIAEFGIDIIGACCGTTPLYISKTAKEISELGGVTHNMLTLRPVENVNNCNEQNESNSFMRLFQKKRKVVAVEIDPPYDENDSKILAAAKVLKDCDVDILTLADSPMGRSRIDSLLMAVKLHRITGMPVMPHICCRDKNMIAMRSNILGAYVNDIRNVLLVTGDPVSSDIRTKTTGVFDYNSIQLMNFVKTMNEEHFSKEPLVYGGALNYRYANVDKIIERMERKIASGARYFLTQPIFTDADVERIALLRSLVNTKILCGIMPLISYRNAYFIKHEMSGIHLPDEILLRYREDMTRKEAEITGAEIASEIIEKLSEFADGYYIMLPFNRASLMKKIVIK